MFIKHTMNFCYNLKDWSKTKGLIMGLFSFLFGNTKNQLEPKETALEQDIYEDNDFIITFTPKLVEVY